jgi:hypothetical protein
MYLVPLKGAIVEALRATFDIDYPEVDFRTLKCSIEYPVAQADYPGIWVNYADTSQLVTAGIGHFELLDDEDSGEEIRVTRWRFGGEITLTVVALSSLERDRLYDEVVRTLAFAREEESVSAFRDIVEQNDFIAMNINFDQVQPSGDQAAPGTPWETDEIIYEKSLTVDVIGEFISRPDTRELVYLSKIRAIGYAAGSPEPPFTGSPVDDPLALGNGVTAAGFVASWPTEWH